MTAPQISVDDLTIWHEEDTRRTIWRGDAELPRGTARDFGGLDDGQLLIRLAVDDDATVVLADLGTSDTLAAIAAARDALDRIAVGLGAVLPHLKRGQCLHHDDDGWRCRLEAHDHLTQHDHERGRS